MKDTTERFVCSHCGHHFDAPPQETIVCPNCFWSTSVKKEEAPVTPEPAPARQTPKVRVSFPFDPSKIRFVAGTAFFVLFLAGIFSLPAKALTKSNKLDLGI